MANTREPILQPIPILSLRPTQMTVGMREVKEKRKRLREHWRKHKKIKQGQFLGRHMIPVVLGPDQRHYVVDHHHLARALHDEGGWHHLRRPPTAPRASEPDSRNPETQSRSHQDRPGRVAGANQAGMTQRSRFVAPFPKLDWVRPEASCQAE
jgi:Putative ParB-like nuclease